MLQKRQVLTEVGPDKRRKLKGGSSSVVSNRVKKREADREEEQLKFLNPELEVQENEAHSAFVDLEQEKPEAILKSTKRAFLAPEDLDNELYHFHFLIMQKY